MGAWGAGSFENDTAMDWTYDIKTVSDVRKPFEILKKQTDAYRGEGDMDVDADLACELLAAAETVAMMMGRKIPDFPEELAEQLENADDVDNLLFHQARNAVLHVFRHSELTELWAEATEDGDVNEWNIEILGLIDRLDPEAAWPPAKAELRGDEAICPYCDDPVAHDERHRIDLYRDAKTPELLAMTICHKTCFTGSLHPKYQD